MIKDEILNSLNIEEQFLDTILDSLLNKKLLKYSNWAISPLVVWEISDTSISSILSCNLSFKSLEVWRGK